MFKKLRNNFLIFNMTITSLLVLVAFVAIFALSFNNVKTHNEEQVMDLVDSYEETYSSTEGERESIGGNLTANIIINEDFDDSDSESPGSASFYTFNFSTTIDPDGDVKAVNSIYNISNSAAQEITDLALSEEVETGVVFYDDMYLQFTIIESNQPVMGHSQLYFLDVTESYTTLKELLVILAIVGVAMIVAIFFISKMYANRAIKPISDNWDRQKQFMADASHELKTPLAIINANYDALMANEDETVKSQERWLNHIKVGSDRMALLVNDMLTLTKMEEGAISVNKSEFNVSNDVLQVASSMEMIAHEKNVVMRWNIEPGVMIHSDQEKFTQLMTILLDNAVKYSNEDGWVEVSFVSGKKGTVLTVSNSGPGIPAADLPNVFNRFYRADKSRGHETRGHGLGLAIAKSIADALGGKIEALSIENECTSFILTL